MRDIRAPTPENRQSPYGGEAAIPASLRRRQLLALLAGGVLAARTAGAGGGGEVPVGRQLRDALLRGLNGPSRRLSQFRGRPLLINVWASWCGPCVEEMPSLERLAWREDRAPFAMIGISTDDYAEAAMEFLRRSNATLSHYIDHDLEMETMLGAGKIPLTVLVDADGRVMEKIHGARQWDAPESLHLLARVFGGRHSVAPA